MMRLDQWLTSTFALALVAGSTVLMGTASAFDEEKIKVSQLPKKVLKAAKKAFPEAIVIGAAKETEDGETIFEVLLRDGDKSIDLGINEDGEIEAIEKEIEVEDLPKAVIRAAAKKFPKGRILKVEEVSDEDDVVVYELSIKVGKKDPVEVAMSPNGKILEPKVKADEDDEKGETKTKKTDKDEDDDKAEAKTEKKDKDEKGETKAKKEMDDDKDEDDEDEDDEKGKAKKKDKDEKSEAKPKKKDMDEDEDDDDDKREMKDKD